MELPFTVTLSGDAFTDLQPFGHMTLTVNHPRGGADEDNDSQHVAVSQYCCTSSDERRSTHMWDPSENSTSSGKGWPGATELENLRRSYSIVLVSLIP